MRELLASIPGLSLKPRKRSNKKLSAAAQIAQTKKGCIDLETPDSILVNTNLRALLNKHTFASLPPLYQYRLVQLLPPIDHVIGPEYSVRLSASALSNEFFARSCQEWRERLAEGEFTPENQQKLKAEAEREHSKLDPWKIKYFEPVWGQKPTSDFPEQGKTSSFLMGASPLKSSLTTPSKHVPTIKIKQLVKKNRLVPAILKHRSSVAVSSSTNNYQVSSNLNAVSHSKLACNVSDGTSNDSSSLKRPLKITIDSSSLTCNKKIKPSTGFTTNPVITTVTASVTATETTEGTPQPNTTQSTSDQEQEQNVQEAANSTVKPKIIPRSAARSPSLVPPITIRSVPVVRPQVGRRGLNRNSDGVNLERSYQICQAVLESSRNRSNFISSGHMQFKARPGIVSTVTKTSISEQCTSTAASIMPQSLGRVVTVGNRSISGTSGPTLLQTVTSQQVTLQSSSSPLLLTTCSPTNDNFALGLGSTTLQIKTIEPDIIGMVTETSITEEVETTSVESNEVVLPPAGQEAVIISNGSMVSLPSNLTLTSNAISDQPSIVVVTDTENQPTSPNSDQVILLTSDVAFTVDSSGETTNPTTVVITAEDGTILAESDCSTDDKNPVLVVTSGLDACTSLEAESTTIEQISVDSNDRREDDCSDTVTTTELAVVSDCFNDLNNQEPSQESDELYIAEDDVQDEITEIQSSEKENSNQSTTILMESAKEEETSNDLPTTEDQYCKNSTSGCDSVESIQDADQETNIEAKEENFCQEKLEEQHCDTPISLSSVESRWRPSSAPPILISKDCSPNETYLLPNIKKYNSCQDICNKRINSLVQLNNCLSRPLSQSFLVVGNTSCARFPGTGGTNSFGNLSFSAGQLMKNGRNVVTLAGEMSHLEMRVATGLNNGLGMVFGQMPLHLGDCGVSASTGLVVNSQLLMSGFPLQHSGIAVNAAGISQTSYPVAPGSILMTQDRTGFNNHLPLNDGHSPAVTMVTPLPIVSTASIFPSVNGTTTVVTAPVQSSNMHGTTGRSPHALVNGVNSETASEGNPGGTIPPSDISGNNNCACNLKAMVMCRKCGAFCHDDCIGPSRLCVTCLIR
ncbi:polycomb protein Asx-like [Centruroides sculpturatus]|uniref:polycomb protein Asx-like n=1 Tax=Centruroides sculpturatus TaxID=218467 RepID=UPI000C6D1191|nr:polycomb protein Asx-like [Centruroides sculpturatus]